MILKPEIRPFSDHFLQKERFQVRSGRVIVTCSVGRSAGFATTLRIQVPNSATPAQNLQNISIAQIQNLSLFGTWTLNPIYVDLVFQLSGSGVET